MRSRQADILRSFAIGAALALSLAATRAGAQSYDVATSPDPPGAYQSFTVSITGSFPADFQLAPVASVDVRDGTIVVHLNGDCLLCAPPVDTTFAFLMRPLAPGAYDLTVFPDGPLAGLSGQTTFTIDVPSNYQGLWWSAPADSEPGWGLGIAHQGDTLFATWFTYDFDGSPMWLAMPSMTKIADRTYAGTIYRTIGPVSSAGGVQAAKSRAAETVGTATFAFDGDFDGTFTYQIGPDPQSKPITRQAFASTMPECRAGVELSAYNFTDLWWEAPAASAPGWGLSVAHEGDVLFAVLFGYDASGKGTWVAMPEMRADDSGVYSGDVYRTRGPAFSDSPWDATKVSVNPSGNATLVFPSREFGTLDYRIEGSAPVTKTITREVFSAPATVCNSPAPDAAP
jgi:hypothetical protein